MAGESIVSLEIGKMVYQIEIAETGQRFAAQADESLLDAALAAGVALPHDCQLGGCGACMTELPFLTPFFLQ